MEGRTAWHQRAEGHLQAKLEEHDSLPSLQYPETIPKVALPPGFKGIAACLLKDSLSPAPIEALLEPRQPDTFMGPMVTTMCATQVIQDEATGVTYLDTVTASMGRVALSNPCMVANLHGPMVEELAEEDLAEGHP